jgi:D-hydroxyproline dehydrogenase subunit beta
VSNETTTDLVVVGAGIVGLAHASEAADRGLRVTVVERDARAVGASIRNFGHICATAQSGDAYDMAAVARESWLRLGEEAGFEVSRHGTVVVARTTSEMAVLEEFAAARPGDEVRLLTPAGVRDLFPPATEEVVGGAHLPRDLRVPPIDAVPAITRLLEARGVTFRWGEHVGAVEQGAVHTSTGTISAPAIVHAVNHDLDRLFPAIAAEYDVRRCILRMFEIAPPRRVRIAPGVLTGTSLLRYDGLAQQPSAALVRQELERDAPELIEVSMNLMLTQRPDGAVILGDTHHYERTHLPFEDEAISEVLLREGARLLGSEPRVERRWRGVYASSTRTDFVVATPHPGTRVVAVTSGIGMTTALGLAPRVLDDLL